MISYSILNTPKLENDDSVSNMTVRLDVGKFKQTVITFDPIRLSADKQKLEYGIVIQTMFIDGINPVDESGVRNINDILSETELNKFYSDIDDIFLDTLKLMKNNINYN